MTGHRFNTTFPILPVLSAIWEVIRRLQKKPKSILFCILRIMITNATSWFPDHTIERLLILGLIMFNFIMNVIVQSKATSILSSKVYDADIDTIEQLVDSNLKVYSFSNHMKAVHDKYYGTKYDKFLEMLAPTVISEGTMDRTTYNLGMDSSRPVLLSFLSEYDIAVFFVRTRNYRRYGCCLYS